MGINSGFKGLIKLPVLGVSVVCKRNVIGLKHGLTLPRYEVSLITFAYLSFPRHPLSGLPSNTEDTDHKVDSRNKHYIKVKVNYRIKCTREIPLQFQQTNLQFMISKPAPINPLVYITFPNGY